MNYSPIHQQIALTFLSGIGSRRARVIISHFNDLDEFFREKKLNLAKIPGISSRFVSHKHRLAALQEADNTLNYLEKLGGKTVFFTETNYPKRLKQCPDAPLLIYIKGNVDLNPEKVVSVVGTRHASEYGKQLTRELVAGLAGTQATVVSGMAYGIDICAHLSALKNNLPTIGVLGHGLDRLYPNVHKKTAAQMLETGGLVTEFPPGLKPEPGNFPMRNRIVAGMADATIVIESGTKGGSLITANLANDYNRDVFAFPGDTTRLYSAGCLQLIQQQKAHLVTGPEDLLRFMSWNTEEDKGKASNTVVQRNLFVELTAPEEKIVVVLRSEKELSMDAIGYLVSQTPADVASNLLNLEFKGLVRQLPGKRYSLI